MFPPISSGSFGILMLALLSVRQNGLNLHSQMEIQVIGIQESLYQGIGLLMGCLKIGIGPW